MKLLAIVSTALLRFGRDRFNAFFVFVLPLAIVLLVGLQYGESPTPTLGVVAPDTPVASALVATLDANERVDVERVTGAGAAAEVLDRVDSGDLDAALIVPDGFDEALASPTGTDPATQPPTTGPVDVDFVSTPFGVGPQLRSIVDDALAQALATPTATAAAVDLGAHPADAARAAAARADLLALIDVSTTTTGDRLFPEDTTGYDIGAAGQVVLFVFLTSLTGSAALIQSRRLGVASRMMSTPTSVATIIGGEALARFVIAALQGIYIMVATSVLFGVEWGDLVASGAVLAVFATVGAAAAMLSGALFSNDEQASGVTVVVALALGALGGSMLPVELFSDTMVAIARVIPHHWALDAFADVVRHDAGVTDVLPQLGVLAAFALAIGVVAVWRMRRALVEP